MSVLGDLLRARAQNTSTQSRAVELAPAPISNAAFSWSNASPVGNSPDLERILALPRRPAEPPEGVVEEQTALYRRPGGSMTLLKHQAWALKEAAQCKGLLGHLGVGSGKTLLSFILPTALKARTTVLLVPSSLKNQCERLYETYAPHWYLPRLSTTSIVYPPAPGQPDAFLHLHSYSSLSSARLSNLLDEIGPDLVCLDECHNVSRSSAARTKRFFRYARQAQRSGKLRGVCALSGTILRRSIRDATGLSKLALGAGSPFPSDWRAAESWALVLDAGSDVSEGEGGELERFCDPGEGLRSGFRRRLVQTPGVVTTPESSVGTALIFHERRVKVPAVVTDAMTKMTQTWVTPGEDEITDALTFWRHARELAAGCYLRWIWPRNEPLALRKEWLDARREWHREIRDYLTHRAGPGLDSPLLLARAAAAGKWASMSYEAWSHIHKQCRPTSEVVWISDFLIKDAVEFGTKKPGIIWYSIDGVGREIAKAGGWPLYGAASEDTTNILDETGRRTIVASVASRSQGLNLQQFNCNLFTSPMSNNKDWEQATGRSHRQGQLADEVNVHLYLHGPLRDGFKSAIKDAQFVEGVLGAKQRLCYASYSFTP